LPYTYLLKGLGFRVYFLGFIFFSLDIVIQIPVDIAVHLPLEGFRV